MSRIGKKPVALVKGVSATISGQTVEVKGPKGTRSFTAGDNVTLTIENDTIKVTPRGTSKIARQQWGMSRSMIENLVIGVSTGFKKEMEIQGVGYRAAMNGNVLKLSLGYSHEVNFAVPAGITVTSPKQTEIIVEGIDQQQVGQVAANIREWRKPEPYKGKGIRPLLLLAFLAEDELALVADAFALIGLGLAPLADVRGDLTNLLLVNAFHNDFGLLRRGDGDTSRNREVYFVAVTQRKLQDVAVHRSAITHTLNFHLFLEAGADADDQIFDHRARHAPLLTRDLRGAARRHLDRVVFNGQRHVVASGEAAGALRAFDFDGLARDRGRDAFDKGDGFLADTRHSTLLRTRCKALRRQHWPRVHLHPT